jgi:hypothetical protein
MLEKDKLKTTPLEENLIDLEDEDDFESEADNMIFAMRTHAEFYSYPKLMEMSKEFNALDSEDKRADYLSTIKLDVNPELEKNLGFGPTPAILEMLFNWLSTLNQDFLVSVANLISDEQTTMLFEGMVYMGLAMDEEDLEE